MKNLRLLLPVVCLAGGLVALSVHAGAPGTDAALLEPGPGGHDHHGGPFQHILNQLDLTADQKTQVKSILTQAHTQMHQQREAARASHEAFLAAAPTAADYPALLATEKANAAAMIQSMSDVKAQIYAILTPAQQAKIPALISAEQAAWASHAKSWHRPQ